MAYILRISRRWTYSSLLSTTQTRSIFQPSFDPYRHDQGRWLNRNKQHHDARILKFDFDALMQAAVRSSPGARYVNNCEKRDGSFNRVFLVHLDNQRTVIARLPFHHAGPAGLTLRSEVATLQYVKQKTSIPVPRVLSWSADATNAIGAEYIIMEELPGVLLQNVWDEMEIADQLRCIQALGHFCKELCEPRFPAYGSLFLRAEASLDTIPIDDTYCIGPVCAPTHWGHTPECDFVAPVIEGYQGPWCNLDVYFSDQITRAKLCARAGCAPLKQRHLELIDIFQRCIDRLKAANIAQHAAVEPILSHPDFHTRKILVATEDHGRITGVIDWRSAAIEPGFLFAATTPDFAVNSPTTGYEALLTKEQMKTWKHSKTKLESCSQKWAFVRQACEKFRPAFCFDPTLIHFLAAPHVGWVDNEKILLTSLKNLVDKWETLGLPGPQIEIPEHPGDDDRLDELETRRGLQRHLMHCLDCNRDGWIPHSRWEEVLPKTLSEYDRFLQCSISCGEYNSEEEAMALTNRVWPWDHRWHSTFM